MLIVARDLFLHDARFRFGSIGVLLIVALVIASFFSPYEDNERLVAPKNRPPSRAHILGTNAIGQDVFWRLTVALRNSLVIGVIATVLSRAIAIFMGLTAGYVGGKTDRILSTVTDGVIVLPRLPLLILLSFVFKARLSIPVMGVLLGALDWAQSSKQYRAQILSLREMGFTATARFSGMGTLKVVLGQHLPFLIPYVMAGFIMGIVWGIGAELTLAVIGLSDLLIPTIGTMVYWSNHYHAIMSNTWWWVAAPVGAAVLAVVALYWLSVSIGGYLDPRTRIQLKTLRS
jgi:peptide/nickel transport system permease protein